MAAPGPPLELFRPVSPVSSASRHRWAVAGTGACLALLIAAAYSNAPRTPFVFDDLAGIVGNPSLRDLRRLGEVLSPRQAAPTEGRPLLNLSFAIDYAWSGLAVESYHVVNVLIHLASALALFGIARRTLQGAKDALPLAASIAAIWALHPLQTEAVTYVSERAESLMGFFCLFTLYAFVRGCAGAGGAPAAQRARESQSRCERPSRRGRRLNGWFGLSLLACACGMATKEVMVTTPVVVLLYDVAFVAGSWREAFDRRRAYHLGLASTWLLLAALMLHSRTGGNDVGLHAGMTPWTYAALEAKAVATYVKLAFWPHPLVFDYGSDLRLHGAVPDGIAVLAGLAGAGWLWRRNRRAGFLAAAFFILLAPTSSVVPIPDQPIAESRMYLPLAAIVALAVCALHRGAGRRIFPAMIAAALAFAAATHGRNQAYASPARLWADTVAKNPGSARAQNNLGMALLNAGRVSQAAGHFGAALQLRPAYADAHANLGDALAREGRLPAALQEFATAVRLSPGDARAREDFANALAQSGRTDEAIRQYERAIAADPNSAEAHYWLASALGNAGRFQEAIAQYDAALSLRPDFPDAHVYRGLALAQLGQPAGAIAEYRAALRLDPGNANARYQLDQALRSAATSPSAAP